MAHNRAKRILITEDDKGDAILIQVVLRENGLEDEEAVACDGREALDYLYCRGMYCGRPPGNPELVILDLKLPKISGLEVLKQMRADEQLKSVQVVIFSSSRDEKDKSECLANGASDFVTKPIDFDEFRKAIKKMVHSYLKSGA